ncbi:ATP-binding protein [Georgenia sp. Z1344]|uniref:sensor histidine kinase n=1 Tax=Georgenia sp. Z1344 TaxID=3416706 RepID=UPI003CF93139
MSGREGGTRPRFVAASRDTVARDAASRAAVASAPTPDDATTTTPDGSSAPPPAHRPWYRRSTVRATIIRTVLMLTGLTLLLVGSTAVWLERGRVLDSVDATLTRTTQEMAGLLSDGQSVDAEDGISGAIWTAMSSEVPADNEGAMGFVGTDARWWQPGGLDMGADTELIAELTEAVERGEGTISSVTTSMSTYRYALLPVTVDDGSDPSGAPTSGAVVIAFDMDAELAPVWASARTYLVVSVVSMLVVGLVAWVVSGRLLAPLRELRSTAERITETDLSGRIEVHGSDDVADLARTVNAMLARLEASFHSQRRLLDDAGHELRTPITIVRGHLELMDPTDADDARQTRELTISELDRMHRLADDLVMLARADGPAFVQPGPTDLGPLLDNALDQVRQLGDRRFVVDARLEAEAVVDGQRLTQALIQLAANAVKFSEDGSTVALGSAAEAGRLHLWVRDEGRGIAREDQRRIFERFERTNRPGEARTEGSGLGLAIVSAIAEAHGGRVDVDSTPGRGSIFLLDLPARSLALDHDVPLDAPDGDGPGELPADASDDEKIRSR